MSLVLTYHDRDAGVVVSDGRVSVRFPDGRQAAVPGETARKFIVLRASPGLALAATSSSGWLYFRVCDAVRRHIEAFPSASFDEVAGIIVPTVQKAMAHPKFRLFRSYRSAKKMVRKFLRAPSASFDGAWADGMNLNLIGYDRYKMRVRNRIFSCMESSEQWKQSERDGGVTINGDVLEEEGKLFAKKLEELIGREHTPDSIIAAMRLIADEISAAHPETIGPPYFSNVVTRGSSI
jgi:hypothetical protein